jgi:glycosyltransferase involved in cell wall biosynthesis
MVVNFVTNINLESLSGGFSGMNRAAWDLIKSAHDAAYVGPLNPKPSCIEHLLSKGQQHFGGGRSFFYYSESRLRRFQKLVNTKLETLPSELTFFHGFTPWIKIIPPGPYVAWSDCTFSQYIDTFHDRTKFSRSDLDRITLQESLWLRKARSVWFRNRFAAAEAIREYGLNEECVRVVGNYGLISAPQIDAYDGRRDILFISTNFSMKGGNVVAESVRQLQSAYPDMRLTVIGDAPSDQIRSLPFVNYLGFLRKNLTEELAILRHQLAKAMVLVHPTRGDTNPMVILEAGYHGCPSIATRLFAIPELVREGETGLLLDDARSVDEITHCLSLMLENEPRYLLMRRAVWEWTRTQYSKEKFDERFLSFLDDLQCSSTTSRA